MNTNEKQASASLVSSIAKLHFSFGMYANALYLNELAAALGGEEEDALKVTVKSAFKLGEFTLAAQKLASLRTNYDLALDPELERIEQFLLQLELRF